MGDKKKNEDMEKQTKIIRELLAKKYTPSLWSRFKDFVGIFFMACFVLLGIAVVVFLIAIIIENPLSLAIICGTILLMWMWGNR